MFDSEKEEAIWVKFMVKVFKFAIATETKTLEEAAKYAGLAADAALKEFKTRDQ